MKILFCSDKCKKELKATTRAKEGEELLAIRRWAWSQNKDGYCGGCGNKKYKN